MTCINLDEANNIRSKSIVLAYIREHESLKSVNIPSVISSTCLKYYFINEFFDQALINYFEISNDKMMITNIGGIIDHSIYCNQWISTSSNIRVQWTFFIKKMKNEMYFGLASNDKNINKDFCNWGSKGPCYEVSNTGERYYIDNTPYNFFGYMSHYDIPRLDKNFRCGSGDTITFILDLNNKTNQFCIQVNDHPRKKLFNNIVRGIDIKYKMAVIMRCKNDSIILKKFQET